MPRDKSRVNGWLRRATKALGLGLVTPHGLRSYFVTQARESGLTDAEIAMLIGDKTGPAIIAAVYGDVRPEHLLKQARRIQLRVGVSNILSNTGTLGSNDSIGNLEVQRAA
jgi:integrase